jgi:hypothetical protein
LIKSTEKIITAALPPKRRSVDAQIPGLSCSTCNVNVSATIRDVAQNRAVTCANGHHIALHDETGRARIVTDAYDRLMQRFHNLGK